METKDNFEALWGSFKEQVQATRKKGDDRDLIYTDDRSMYGGHVSVRQGDEDGASLYVASKNSHISINCQPAGLRAIAAQCLAAAEEVEEAQEEAKAVRPNMNTYEPLDRLTIRTAK